MVRGCPQQGADVHRRAPRQVQGEVQQAQGLGRREPLALLAWGLGDQVADDGSGCLVRALLLDGPEGHQVRADSGGPGR